MCLQSRQTLAVAVVAAVRGSSWRIWSLCAAWVSSPVAQTVLVTHEMFLVVVVVVESLARAMERKDWARP